MKSMNFIQTVFFTSTEHIAPSCSWLKIFIWKTTSFVWILSIGNEKLEEFSIEVTGLKQKKKKRKSSILNACLLFDILAIGQYLIRLRDVPFFNTARLVCSGSGSGIWQWVIIFESLLKILRNNFFLFWIRSCRWYYFKDFEK